MIVESKKCIHEKKIKELKLKEEHFNKKDENK
jgi:hypothetical protein